MLEDQPHQIREGVLNDDHLTVCPFTEVERSGRLSTWSEVRHLIEVNHNRRAADENKIFPISHCRLRMLRCMLHGLAEHRRKSLEIKGSGQQQECDMLASG